MASKTVDPHSASNYDQARVTHAHLDLTADFSTSTLSGSVTLSVELDQDTSSLIVDTRDIDVHSAKAGDADLQFSFGETTEAFGTGLTVTLPEDKRSKGSKFKVTIAYTTSPTASAVQWFQPEQTLGKKHPYLFTQCQAIHCRSMIPIQDAPGNKITYTARITVPAPLVALMSANSTGSTTLDDGRIAYTFEQKVVMPSYLIALAIGALKSKDIGPRTRVWCEEEQLEAAAYEFAETEKFVKIGEDICGPYVWGRYDLLVLPPSFPYGGMENPQLTFVTPTLLAGDRSLSNVVAHEVTHSWMGNLVTNRTWEHFWLNEGFTVYVERKIIAAIDGEQMRHLSAEEGYNGLKSSVEHFGCSHGFTALVPAIDGVDPDDSFSSVPYEKGFNLLFYLESLLGVEAMNNYLKAHVKKWQYKTFTTSEWKEFFCEFHKDSADKLAAVDWDTWFNKPGMLPVEPKFDTTLASAATDLAATWWSKGKGDFPTEDTTTKWFPAQRVVFLDKFHGTEKEVLAADASPEVKAQIQEKLSAMDALYNFSKTQNSEIRFRWLLINILANNKAIFPAAVEMATTQGRMKFTRPLFRELYKNKDSRALAVESFKKNAGFYHSICSKMVAKDLELSSDWSSDYKLQS